MRKLEHMQERFKNLRIIKDLLPFLWTKEEKIRSLFLFAFGLIFISIGLDLSIPLVLKEVVSCLALPDKSMTYQLSLLLVAYGIIWALSQVIQNVRQIIMVRPLESCIRLFCSKFFDHLHSLPMTFHMDRKTGSLTNALERAQHGFPDVFWGMFLFIIPTIIELFLAATILCYFYGAIYGFLLLFIATVFIIFTLYATKWASHFQTLSNEQQSNTNANIVDSLLNFASVKYFNNKEHEVLKCDTHLKKREKLLVKSISSMELVQIGQSLIIGAGLVLLTYTAGKQTLLNVYDVSDFVLINGYVLQFVAPLSQMGFIARNVRRGLNELSDIMKIYRIKSPPSISSRGSNSFDKLENIEFKNVSFGYEPSRLVLNDVSFTLEAGKTIGIVGETGSGKSTISSLLFKFYDVNSGKILINNVDIQSLDSNSLYKLLGIVPQDVTLFNMSIYENILFGRPSAQKEEVEEAIKLAYLEPFLKRLPGHYDTIVGERGLKLSGGEKQRIAIARVLLKRPTLYVFDEATSSLDLKTEETIMNNIAPLLKKSTSLIIAHRLSTVVNADEILVLHNGIVQERGTHLSLLREEGSYASLWRAQEEAHKKSYAA
ncbi:MAG: ATP-binding cassette domain-containing protein [Alphaproteobacteria bacterium]|jgi:ABC-type transport system involved in Fe-S cluster assembly fused permease/ATPase subunit|nr:ATP-binding cassette domain-containing protein [Alphaproteobacteria bacterium]MDI9634192.1 ATP-binding cassette domain-containing protein [Geitlerinema splendidum]